MAFSKSNILEENLGATEQTKLNRVTIQFTLGTVSNDSYWLMNYAPTSMTLTDLHAETASGTCDVTVRINGTNVTGMASVSCSSTRTSVTATANNVIGEGDKLVLDIASNVDGDMLGITIEGYEN